MGRAVRDAWLQLAFGSVALTVDVVRRLAECRLGSDVRRRRLQRDAVDAARSSGALSDEGDTVVWGTADEGDTVVWGTTDERDTVVWGTSCTDPRLRAGDLEEP